MKPNRFLLGLRALITVGYELRKLRESVDRCADALEGRASSRVLPPAEPEPLSIEYGRDHDYAHIHRVEMRLHATLGRMPTPEELAAELDGEEMPALETTVVAGQRRPTL